MGLASGKRNDVTKDQFTFATRVGRTHQRIGTAKQFLDRFELAPCALVTLDFELEMSGDERQGFKSPLFERGIVFVGRLEPSEVSERPRDLVTLALEPTVALALRTEMLRQFARDRRLLGEDDLHWRRDWIREALTVVAFIRQRSCVSAKSERVYTCPS